MAYIFYFFFDESVKAELKNSYRSIYNDWEKVQTIFKEFGLDFATGHIIHL